MEGKVCEGRRGIGGKGKRTRETNEHRRQNVVGKAKYFHLTGT